MNLQLALKRKWFEMTKSGEKTEDYREITPYWVKRFVKNHNKVNYLALNYGLCAFRDGYTNDQLKKDYGISIKEFEFNIMTLGYPKKEDSERILKLEHKGIEIRQGNPEWGAEPGEFYFVIKHGVKI
jgi:hypothetical protein